MQKYNLKYAFQLSFTIWAQSAHCPTLVGRPKLLPGPPPTPSRFSKKNPNISFIYFTCLSNNFKLCYDKCHDFDT